MRPIQLWNFPESAKFHLKFAIDTESDNIEQSMEAIKFAWDLGMRLKESDVASRIGVSVASDDDKQLFNPELVTQIESMGDKNRKSLADAVLEKWAERNGVAA